MSENSYESDELLNQYLLFHYGSSENIVPAELLQGLFPQEITLPGIDNYPKRCLTEFLPPPTESSIFNRGLDLGCAVGRSSFEMTNWCGEVIGIDLSTNFIKACNEIKQSGEIHTRLKHEGNLQTPLHLKLSPTLKRNNVSFEVGNAEKPSSSIGKFDLILLANLIDRVNNPAKALNEIAKLLNPNGKLIITSPYTWLEEFTPTNNWLTNPTEQQTTLKGIKNILQPEFELIETRNIPFLIREHQRKYQWSIAEGSLWIKN